MWSRYTRRHNNDRMAEAPQKRSVPMQFFERPKELMTGDQQDDLLFFVVHEAYQVVSPQLHILHLEALCLSRNFGACSGLK